MAPRRGAAEAVAERDGAEKDVDQVALQRLHDARMKNLVVSGASGVGRAKNDVLQRRRQLRKEIWADLHSIESATCLTLTHGGYPPFLTLNF